jgi:hypothetical protein
MMKYRPMSAATLGALVFKRVVVVSAALTWFLGSLRPARAHRPTILTICVAAFLSVFAILPSRSEASQIVVYNNFGPDQSYGLSYYFLAGALGLYNEQSIAAPFTPTTTTTFDSVLLPVGFIEGFDNGVNVSIVQDVAGEPGPTPLATFQTGELAGYTNSGVLDVSWNRFFGFPDPVLTAGTTYWIAVTPSIESEDAWYFNTTGADVASQSSDGGLGWSRVGPYPAPVAPAFEVLGDTVSTPEPSAFAMLAGLAGMGAIGLTWVRRRAAAH